MNKYQRGLLNTYIKWVKEFKQHYSSEEFSFTLLYSTLIINTGKPVLHWKLMEKMQEITENVSWDIFTEDNQLKIRLSK